MEFRVIGLNFLYAVLGVVLMFISYRVIDRLTIQRCLTAIEDANADD